MKNTQKIFTYLLLFYGFWFMLYFFKNIHAPIRRLVLIPLVFGIISTMFYSLFKKPIRRTFRQIFDKNYRYNKPIKKIKANKTIS